MTDKRTPVYAAALTDPGGRRNNEDAVYTCEAVEDDKIAARGQLYIVADGTGGQEGGQTASSMAAAIIGEHFYDDTSSEIGESLRTAIVTAHEALYELAQRVKAWAEMSTTLVAAVLRQGRLYVAHVGDSRAYLVRDGEARLLTRDHVWLKDDENYGALTRWLGGTRRPSVEVDLTTETLQEDDVIVLCSDGLSDVVYAEDIGALVGRSSPQTAGRQLIEVANRQGTGDNVSAAVIQYGGKAPRSPLRRWAGLGGGVVALLGLAVALALILNGGPEEDGSNVESSPIPNQQTPAPTQLLPAEIEVEETSTVKPIEVAPSLEKTHGPTSTPVPVAATPTPSSMPLAPEATQQPVRVKRPDLVSPSQGVRDQANPMTFQWEGSLRTGHAYRVTVWHPETGHRIQSDPRIDRVWSVDLPTEKVGDWRWMVSVVQDGRVVATSDERMFWFNPIPGGGDGGEETTPTPRR